MAKKKLQTSIGDEEMEETLQTSKETEEEGKPLEETSSEEVIEPASKEETEEVEGEEVEKEGIVEEEEVEEELETKKWKEKFIASSKEALRLREELKKTQAQVEELVKQSSTEIPPEKILASRIPDWEYYDEEQRKIYLTLFEIAKNEALKAIKFSPEIKMMKKLYEEKQWQEEFSEVIKEYPELIEKEEKFKKFSFREENKNVPLKILAKAFLFPESKKIGAKEEKEKLSREGLERATGGEKIPLPEMTEEDWMRLARTNPQEFKRRAKEFELWLNRTTSSK